MVPHSHSAAMNCQPPERQNPNVFGYCALRLGSYVNAVFNTFSEKAPAEEWVLPHDCQAGHPTPMPTPLQLLGDGTRVTAGWWGAGSPQARGHLHSGRQGCLHSPRDTAKVGGLVIIHPSACPAFLCTVSVDDGADLPWDCPRAEIRCGHPGLWGHSTPLCSFSHSGTDYICTLTGCPYKSAILLIHPFFIFLNFLQALCNLKTIRLT